MSTLASCQPLAAQNGQRFKQIDYHYDLISGKVNEVHYQASQPDALYHKYAYDADNRITKVHTSKDSINWDQDASYTYYAHGPLARVELGDNKVQGMDYAYTLQGWIKGVNSNLLKAENDIGNDGLSGSAHSRVAKDAFGYSLNYHANDYQAIDAANWSNTALRFEALTPNSDLMAARFDLYNGNISSMVTTIVEPKVYTGGPNQVPNILPQGTAYQYDQLNRLLEMRAFQNLDIATNKWKQGSTYAGLYHNLFKYDANGNILGQFRADQTGKVIDSLTYKYAKDALGHTKQNRLYHVKDQVNPLAFTDDIDDQGPSNTDYKTANNGSNNYTYDEIGNLSSDKQEGIAKIEWTLYSKIKSITRTSVSLRSDLEFQYDASGNRIAKIEKPRDANGLKPASEWIATYYARDAQGNVMGMYKHQPLTVGPSFKVMERNVYGSSRLGSDYSEVELIIGPLPTANPSISVLGAKHFEGSNHLGNVLAVVSDRKIPRDDDGDGVIDYFQGEVLSANDYSPFGVVLDGRDFGVGGRYGFNGKEMDDEIKGEGNSLDFGARVYDSRIGKFLSIDPYSSKFQFLTPFAFTNNNPILFIDKKGAEWVNPYTSMIEEKQKALLNSPNDKTLKKEMNVLQNKELRVKEMLSNLKKNDEALYNYVDKLEISLDDKKTNIKVYVYSNENSQGAGGQVAETKWFKSGDQKTPNVNYDDKQIVAPISPKNKKTGFDVTIYGETSFGDERLSNEIGDIMYYMEYNDLSIKSKSDSQIDFFDKEKGMNEYLKEDGPGNYSYRVFDKYRERKKSGEGKEKSNSPYPLKLKQEEKK